MLERNIEDDYYTLVSPFSCKKSNDDYVILNC